MTGRKRDLSRLSGLLTVAAEAGQPASAAPTSLAVSQLKPSTVQPRREFDAARIQQLADSIRERGVLQPLLVRRVGDGYEIVAGERRWRAARLAGLEEVPVFVRDLGEAEARHLALVENLQREDLNAVDEADAKLGLVALQLGVTPEEARSRLMQMLREPAGEDHARVDDLFRGLGESWTYFAKNKLRILNWPGHVLDAVRAGLPFTLAGVIVTAPADHQAQLLEQARQGASREELRAMVKALQVDTRPQRARQAKAIARMLASSRWVEGLNPEEQKALDRWLAAVPPVLRKAIKP